MYIKHNNQTNLCYLTAFSFFNGFALFHDISSYFSKFKSGRRGGGGVATPITPFLIRQCHAMEFTILVEASKLIM